MICSAGQPLRVLMIGLGGGSSPRCHRRHSVALDNVVMRLSCAIETNDPGVSGGGVTSFGADVAPRGRPIRRGVAAMMSVV